MLNQFHLYLLFNFLFVAFYAQAQVSTVSNHSPLLFEKAYLHTDRDVYAMGDTLWFKAYLVNGQDHKPALSSGNLYVELISPDSAKIVLRETIRMENGLGHGDMALDDSLRAGHYTLRAYTNWMRNFGDNFVFEKEITLLDTKAIPEVPDPKASAKNKKTAAAASNKTATATLPPATNILPIVRFYPEGGSLVQGISSFVGVKAEDGYGKGILAKGTVVSASGDTVAHFTCDSLGMGVFTLLPLVGQSYHAVVQLGVRHDQFQLPSALSNGLALQIRSTDSVIHAIVSTSDTTVKASGLLTVKQAGITLLRQSFQLQDRQLVARIATASLPEGISAITLYDQQNKPECERLVYIHHPNAKGSLTVSTDKRSYQSKEKAIITIQTQPNSNLSMAVVDAGVVPVQNEDIVSYLNLQSELRGNIESPGRYFDTTNVNRFKQLDQLLLTQGWRDFVWRRMADTSIRISYAAENGIPVPGRIRDENLNRLLPNLNITLYAPGAKGNKMFMARSDSMGRFHFNELMLYGKQNVTLSAVNDKGQSKGAFWVDTLLPMPVKPQLIRNQVKEDSLQKMAVQKRQADWKPVKVNGITQLKEVKIKARGKSQAFSVEGLPGNSFTVWGEKFDQNFKITPKDYELKTLRWFAINKFMGAQVAGDQIAIPVGLHGVSIPILIINGKAPLFPIDPNLYYSMPLEKFKNIHLQQVADQFNTLRYLLFIDLKDDYLTDNPGSLTTNIEGYYQARVFYEPLPNAKPSMADYRSTIFWQPDIKTDVNGKAAVSFYNALPQTDVRVIVQGISVGGIPLTSTANYEIK